MTDHTSTLNRPLWEEFNGANLHDLIGLMAEEMWERTGGPRHAAEIAVAEFAHVLDPGDRQGQIRLDDAYRDEATRKGTQCTVFGFYLAITIGEEPLLGTEPGRWFDRTMERAKIVPLTDTERAALEELIHHTLAVSEQVRNRAKNPEEKATE